MRIQRAQRSPRSARRASRGFALVVAMILLALLAATVTLALRDATSSLAETGRSKSTEIAYADLNRGLAESIRELEGTDPLALMSAANDIFRNPPEPAFRTIAAPAANTPYPVPIRVGLRPGQRTQPPPGEDVRSGYGYVVEIQLQADVDTAAGLAPAQERVSVGVRLPGVISHSSN